MNKIAYLKPFIGNSAIERAYVRAKPGGKIIGSIAKGEWVMLPVTPTRHSASSEWTEIWFPARKLRGWMATALLDIHNDPLFDTGETVPERQVKYEKSVSFPRPPEILDTVQRAAFRWGDLFVSVIIPILLVCGLLYGCAF